MVWLRGRVHRGANSKKPIRVLAASNSKSRKRARRDARHSTGCVRSYLGLSQADFQTRVAKSACSIFKMNCLDRPRKLDPKVWVIRE